MRILFASGKGGAGKTTVTAGLAALWPRPFVLADADVEAPDLSLFITHEWTDEQKIGLEVPVAVNDRCNLCGRCLDLCQFNAIIRLGNRIVPFSKMCHSCGGCTEICRRGAIEMGTREIGSIRIGTAFGKTPFYEGRSRIGEAMTPPLIRDLLKKASEQTGSRDLLIDSPPGVSCPITTAARFADTVILVADPTPFGFHDFKLAFEALSDRAAAIGVIVNRSGREETADSEKALTDYCLERGIPVVAKFPFEREAAAACAAGKHPVETYSRWQKLYREASESIVSHFGDKNHD